MDTASFFLLLFGVLSIGVALFLLYRAAYDPSFLPYGEGTVQLRHHVRATPTHAAEGLCFGLGIFFVWAGVKLRKSPRDGS